MHSSEVLLPQKRLHKTHYHVLLATGRVYLAAPVAMGTGGLLPHRFTITAFTAVYSLLHLPSDYSGHPLDGTLSCM
jgi:hypothetical protein